MTGMPIIRRACAADASALSVLAESTFRAAFAASNRAEDMALHCAKHYGEQIQAGEIADPETLTLVAEERAQLLGYAQLRRGPTPACVAYATPAELQRLYVAADWHGRGVAHRLLEACFAALRSRGAASVWLGVWERNPRAIAFYRKQGFVEVGEHRFVLGDDPQRDLIMARPLCDESVSAPRRG